MRKATERARGTSGGAKGKKVFFFCFFASPSVFCDSSFFFHSRRPQRQRERETEREEGALAAFFRVQNQPFNTRGERQHKNKREISNTRTKARTIFDNRKGGEGKKEEEEQQRKKKTLSIFLSLSLSFSLFLFSSSSIVVVTSSLRARVMLGEQVCACFACKGAFFGKCFFFFLKGDSGRKKAAKEGENKEEEFPCFRSLSTRALSTFVS